MTGPPVVLDELFWQALTACVELAWQAELANRGVTVDIRQAGRQRCAPYKLDLVVRQTGEHRWVPFWRWDEPLSKSEVVELARQNQREDDLARLNGLRTSLPRDHHDLPGVIRAIEVLRSSIAAARPAGQLMSSTHEHVEGGFRFALAGGSTYIAIKQTEALMTSVPYDMMEIPRWINRSALDGEGFRMLCRLWLARMQGRT